MILVPTSGGAVEPISTFEVDPATARVHEHGWQSWTPTTTYRLDETPHRPAHELFRVLHCRAEAPDPGPAFQGDGLLAVDDGHGRVHVLAAPDGRREVPTIRAEVDGGRVTIRADAEVEHLVDESGGGIDAALARWADGTVDRLGLGAVRPAPTVWCSWYHYYTEVTEADVDENLEAIGHHELDVDVVQLDDGYQSAIGDWLTLSERFASVADMVGRIRAAGRRAGIWLAPFLVGERSRLAAEHPDWLVGGPDAPVSAGHNWEQDLAALDVTHPVAAADLTRVLTEMRSWGVDYFKIDFVYAGALPGRRHDGQDALAAYRHGLDLVRDAIGDDAYLLGCGAPLLPSLGKVDAMRVSPDTGPNHEPIVEDEVSLPSTRSAMLTGAARAFQHGRFWVNDPDCLIVRPAVERREAWAEHVERFGGLRASSDRIADLDDWGLATTRRLLAGDVPATFVAS